MHPLSVSRVRWYWIILEFWLHEEDDDRTIGKHDGLSKTLYYKPCLYLAESTALKGFLMHLGFVKIAFGESCRKLLAGGNQLPGLESLKFCALQASGLEIFNSHIPHS